jgi:hypothetical protein
MNVALAGLEIERLILSILRDARLELKFEVKVSPESRTAAVLTSFQGPDVALLLARNAELLLALEHIAVQALRLESEQHDLISFDAGGFKARRDEAIPRTATAAPCPGVVGASQPVGGRRSDSAPGAASAERIAGSQGARLLADAEAREDERQDVVRRARAGEGVEGFETSMQVEQQELMRSRRRGGVLRLIE